MVYGESETLENKFEMRRQKPQCSIIAAINTNPMQSIFPFMLLIENITVFAHLVEFRFSFAKHLPGVQVLLPHRRAQVFDRKKERLRFYPLPGPFVYNCTPKVCHL